MKKTYSHFSYPAKQYCEGDHEYFKHPQWNTIKPPVVQEEEKVDENILRIQLLEQDLQREKQVNEQQQNEIIQRNDRIIDLKKEIQASIEENDILKERLRREEQAALQYQHDLNALSEKHEQIIDQLVSKEQQLEEMIRRLTQTKNDHNQNMSIQVQQHEQEREELLQRISQMEKEFLDQANQLIEEPELVPSQVQQIENLPCVEQTEQETQTELNEQKINQSGDLPQVNNYDQTIPRAFSAGIPYPYIMQQRTIQSIQGPYCSPIYLNQQYYQPQNYRIDGTQVYLKLQPYTYAQ